MGEDEEATLAALRIHQIVLIDPKIDEYNGRVANTASDGLLIKFPSVIVALRFAEDVQRGMADRNVKISEDCCIVFRVGINLDNLAAQLKLH